MSSWFTSLINKIGSFIPARGAFVRGDSEDFPVAINNQLAGGFYMLPTLDDLRLIPHSHYSAPMAALVGTGDNVAFYILKNEPDTSDFTAGILQNYDEFWALTDIINPIPAAGVLIQYADDYAPSLNKQPPYPNDPSDPGYASNLALYHANQAPYDQWYTPQTVTSTWQRFSYDNGTTYGPPITLGGVVVSGDYIDVIFRWFDPMDTITRPTLYDGAGTLNNKPTGWGNTVGDLASPDPGDLLYITFSLKSTNGQLRSEWATPILVGIDPIAADVAQFGEFRNSPDADWVTVDNFVLGTHRWLRRRVLNTDPWIYLLIDNEAGEYQKTVYKLYNISLTDTIRDNPNDYRPVGSSADVNGSDAESGEWQELPPTETNTTIVFASKGTFNNQGNLKGDWSDPYTHSGKDVFLDFIETPDGDSFKRVTDGSIVPTSLTLVPRLYRGVVLIGSGVTVTWKKIRENGSLVDIDIVSTDSNDDLYLVGDNLEVKPDGVDNQSLFQVQQVYSGITFTQTLTVTDIADGTAVVIDTDSSANGYVYAVGDSVDKDITFTVYDNGTAVSFGSLSSVSFQLDGTTVVDTDTYAGETVSITEGTITITEPMVTDVLTITFTATYNSVVRTRTVDIIRQLSAEALDILYHIEYIDTATGNSVEPPYSAMGSISTNTTSPFTWTTASDSDTKWILTKPESATTWNAPIKIGGDQGLPGTNGGFKAFVYLRSDTRPATPSGMRNPGGVDPNLGQEALPATPLWQADKYEGNGSLWQSESFWVDISGGGTFILLGTWSSPIQVVEQLTRAQYSIAEKLYLDQFYS